MLLSYNNGITSVILRVKLLNSSVATGAGLAGLTSASTGLIISTIADTESTATAYTVAGSTIETITTNGTFAAPTATKCRFKEIDATNHPGVYEIQIANARYAVSNARSLIVSISGATNLAQADCVIQLTAATPPTNFALMAIDSNGMVTLAPAQTFDNTGTSTDATAAAAGVADLQSRTPAALTAAGNMKSDILRINGTTVAGNGSSTSWGP